MKAIQFESFGGPLSIIETPMPIPNVHGAVIKVQATGLCRSDWHAWMGHDSDIVLPHIPGHEFSGIVESVGKSVRKVAVGDRVVVPFVCGCGICEYCRSGNAQVCPNQTQPGFTHFGSFAQFVAISGADFNVVKLPNEISFETGASLGCRFATSFRALTKRANIQPGETVAIFGCGGIGLSAIMIAKALGAVVIAVDISDAALMKAQEIGADLVVNSSREDALNQIDLLTQGGADISIDALGSEEIASTAILSLKRRGRHLQLGLLPSASGRSAIPMARVIAYELDLLGGHGMAAQDYPEMLELIISGKLKPDSLIESVVSLEEGALALENFAFNKSAGITIIKI
ncbi:MAG: zinc-dependent alcohol dehydrogenase family protein [Actinomycetes bacterium]